MLRDRLFWVINRYVDVSGAPLSTSNLTFTSDLHVLELMQFLNLSRCALTSLNLTDLPALRILDLSHNRINNLSTLTLGNLSGLEWLDLSHNPLVPRLDGAWTSVLKEGRVVKVSFQCILLCAWFNKL